MKMNRIVWVIALTLVAGLLLTKMPNAVGNEISYNNVTPPERPPSFLDRIYDRDIYWMPSDRRLDTDPGFISAIWDTAKAPFKFLGAPITAAFTTVRDIKEWMLLGKRIDYAKRVQGEQGDAIFQVQYALPTALSRPTGLIADSRRGSNTFMRDNPHPFPPGWAHYPSGNGLMPKLVLSVFPCAMIACIVFKKTRKILGIKGVMAFSSLGGVYAAGAILLSLSLSGQQPGQQTHPAETAPTPQAISSPDNNNSASSQPVEQTTPAEATVNSPASSTPDNNSVGQQPAQPTETTPTVAATVSAPATNPTASVPPADAVPAAPPSEPTPSLTPQLQEVVKLTQAKMNDDVILNYIKSSNASYDLSAADILYLNTQGVSTPVIAAMLQSKASAVSAAATTTPISQVNPSSSILYAGQPAMATGGADALVNQGNTLCQSGQYGEALQYFDRALEVDPNAPHALYGKAVAEDSLRHPSEAIRNYRKFIKVASPQDANMVETARDRLLKLGWHGASP